MKTYYLNDDEKKLLEEIESEDKEYRKQSKQIDRSFLRTHWPFMLVQILMVSLLLFLADENQQKLLEQRRTAIVELQQEHPNYQKVLDYSHCYYDYHSEIYWKLVGMFSSDDFHKEAVENDIRYCEDMLGGY